MCVWVFGAGLCWLLAVVDCHQGWCGPCKAITNTLRRIFFEFGERPLKMYTANVDEVKCLEKYRGSCQPVFMLYMVRCLRCLAPCLAQTFDRAERSAVWPERYGCVPGRCIRHKLCLVHVQARVGYGSRGLCWLELSRSLRDTYARDARLTSPSTLGRESGAIRISD